MNWVRNTILGGEADIAEIPLRRESGTGN